MRILLKYAAFAEALRAGLSRIEPDAQIFFSLMSLGAGFLLPKLAGQIAEAEAFLLLIGPNGVGPRQDIEYLTAFDRHVNDKRFPLVPVFGAGAAAPRLVSRSRAASTGWKPPNIPGGSS